MAAEKSRIEYAISTYNDSRFSLADIFSKIKERDDINETKFYLYILGHIQCQLTCYDNCSYAHLYIESSYNGFEAFDLKLFEVREKGNFWFKIVIDPENDELNSKIMIPSERDSGNFTGNVKIVFRN